MNLHLLHSQSVMIDADYSFGEAVKGSSAPDSIIRTLDLIKVQYYSFDGKLHQGQLMIHKKLISDITQVFELIKKTKFPIAKVIPMVRYQWDDNASMADNNSSSFNFREITGGKKRLSFHAYGVAIDLNPIQNPYIKGNVVQPKNSTYRINQKGTLSSQSDITLLFKHLGWDWGGDWTTLKDYQHYEKKSVLK